MADEAKTNESPATNTDSEVKNLKAEFNRKLGNIEETLKASNDRLMAQMAAMAPKAPAPPKAALSDMIYSDPNGFAQEVIAAATQSATNIINNDKQSFARQQKLIAGIAKEFPEVNNGDHQLTQLAIDKYNSMDESDKQSPVAYKTAVYDAALELGIKPKSKRSDEESDAYTGGSSGRTSTSSSKRKGELDPRTTEFARLVGIDVDDPKVLERLKNRAKRTNYTRYE